jgi:hypothetical protein
MSKKRLETCPENCLAVIATVNLSKKEFIRIKVGSQTTVERTCARHAKLVPLTIRVERENGKRKLCVTCNKAKGVTGVLKPCAFNSTLNLPVLPEVKSAIVSNVPSIARR